MFYFLPHSMITKSSVPLCFMLTKNVWVGWCPKGCPCPKRLSWIFWGTNASGRELAFAHALRPTSDLPICSLSTLGNVGSGKTSYKNQGNIFLRDITRSYIPQLTETLDECYRTAHASLMGGNLLLSHFLTLSQT